MTWIVAYSGVRQIDVVKTGYTWSGRRFVSARVWLKSRKRWSKNAERMFCPVYSSESAAQEVWAKQKAERAARMAEWNQV